MRRLFPLALLLLACPSKKDRVGEPLDAAVVMGGAADGWVLTPEKLDAYLRYQKATLVHAGVLQPAGFDGGPLKNFEDTPEAHADFDEWLRKTNGLTEDDVKKLDLMMGPLAMMTVTQMMPAQEAAQKEAAELAKVPLGEQAATTQLQLKHNDGKRQLEEMRQKYGEGNVRVLMTRQYDLVENWLKITGVNSGVTR